MIATIQNKTAVFWKEHHIIILLAVLMVLALGLRVWGIRFGLPNLEHPDEDAVLMPALQIIKTGNLEPERMGDDLQGFRVINGYFFS